MATFWCIIRLNATKQKGSLLAGGSIMKRILVIDDVYSVRLKIELVLRHAGRFQVRSVQSGSEAIQVALAEPPDALVMDIVMKDMDGFQTLRELRSQGVECPIIAYTARAEHGSGEFASHGFAAYVSKSDNVSSLLAVLRVLLNQDTIVCVAEEPVSAPASKALRASSGSRSSGRLSTAPLTLRS